MSGARDEAAVLYAAHQRMKVLAELDGEQLGVRRHCAEDRARRAARAGAELDDSPCRSDSRSFHDATLKEAGTRRDGSHLQGMPQEFLKEEPSVHGIRE